MSANIRWTQVNGSLTLSNRMHSGYEYRIRRRDNGSALLIAEASNPYKPIRRQECASIDAAFKLADQWESMA